MQRLSGRGVRLFDDRRFIIGFQELGLGWLESLHVVEGTEAGLISAGQVPRSSSMIEKVKFATGSLVEGD